MAKMYTIYKTTNVLNGKIYIGQSTKDDDSYLGSGEIIKKAINKYGKESFIKEILLECKTKKELDEKEIFYIEKYNSTDKKIGYNISHGGNAPLLPKWVLEKRSSKVKREGTFSYKNNGNFKYDIPKKELVDLYIHKGYKIQSIADKYGCSYYNIRRLIKKYEIKKSPSNIICLWLGTWLDLGPKLKAAGNS